EVAEVRTVFAIAAAGRARLIHDLFALLALVDLESPAAHGHPPVAAVVQIADGVAVGAILQAALAPRRQAADFKDDLGIAIVEGRDLRVRRLLIVFVDELAAG